MKNTTSTTSNLNLTRSSSASSEYLVAYSLLPASIAFPCVGAAAAANPESLQQPVNKKMSPPWPIQKKMIN
ncbi:hypothetical protein ACSBR1_003120 [Camellia fascicularis]